MHTLSQSLNRALNVSSPSFSNYDEIPDLYTCDGKNISPCIEINNIPSGTKSLAIIVEDIDAPIAPWSHWVMWDIPVKKAIKQSDTSGMQGINDFGKHEYCGPCPISGTHEYHYTVYALDCHLFLHSSSTKYHLEKAMSGHIIAQGTIIGFYKKADKIL